MTPDKVRKTALERFMAKPVVGNSRRTLTSDELAEYKRRAQERAQWIRQQRGSVVDPPSILAAAGANAVITTYTGLAPPPPAANSGATPNSSQPKASPPCQSPQQSQFYYESLIDRIGRLRQSNVFSSQLQEPPVSRLSVGFVPAAKCGPAPLERAQTDLSAGPESPKSVGMGASYQSQNWADMTQQIAHKLSHAKLLNLRIKKPAANEVAPSEKQFAVVLRSQNWLQQKTRKLAALRAEKKGSETEGCTFRPQLFCPNKSSSIVRESASLVSSRNVQERKTSANENIRPAGSYSRLAATGGYSARARARGLTTSVGAPMSCRARERPILSFVEGRKASQAGFAQTKHDLHRKLYE